MPWSIRSINKKYDVFISHATEDKDTFVRPLAKKLKELGIKVWYDEFTLKLGDSLRRKIDEGLIDSRYGIVVLSPDFFAQEWTNRELDGLTSIEINGAPMILPIWHMVNKNDVLNFSPTLADRVSIKSSEGMDIVVEKIMKVLFDPNYDLGSINGKSSKIDEKNKDQGKPIIKILEFPKFGTYGKVLGKVWNIDHKEYYIAVYIYVKGEWWTKPFWAQPKTEIESNGKWSCNITTGGIDEITTKIAAFIISNKYDPPLCDGNRKLPKKLKSISIKKTIINRNPELK